MFPLDSNLLVGILIVTTISAYILILKKLRQESIRTNKIPNQDSNRNDLKTRKKGKNVKKVPKIAESKKSQTNCSHHFGYLRSLPKNASLPDKCLGCPNIIECLTHERIKKSRRKQK